eukprot:CAMPEP_0185739296 /NCGR_PEP_ID=MMETSP1171-20130828/35085_1 /TAXON_ID=374046 /ORGANISM="Helicotheca tamensis, Strain CCMP826" /LENGTH=35 /DNA_ID= /DNA_START= /DNA_END= /DNA_ORIENTATION=
MNHFRRHGEVTLMTSRNNTKSSVIVLYIGKKDTHA